ncbi:MAG: electron transfer flavoprotein subunit alpha/FixB family protein, partial [Halobacillus sp.]|uniref:electron transfer flavoprotein subunit alpha/FixB family protein n=1 Tax=Halobacillus sp. TaxID=56800 RepID=UPI003BAEBE3C
MSKKVLVIGEAREGSLRNVTFEAIAAGNIVSDGGEVVGVLCGAGDLNSMAQEMVYYGASRVITVANEELKTYTSDGYGQAIYQVIKDESPEGIIMGHTAIGKDVTPKLASRLESGLVSDATEVVVEDGNIVFTRPIYSGKAFEKKEVTDGLVFATIRPNNIPALTRDDSLAGEVTEKEVEISNIRTIIKDVIKKSSEGVDLSEAKVIVAGGRGVKSSEGFEPLQELA